MSGNPYAWLGLAAAVIAVLAHKGYFSFFGGTHAVSPPPVPQGPNDLTSMGQAFALAVKAQAGHAFALAVKAEADMVIARQFAQEAMATNSPNFVFPFPPAAPADHPTSPFVRESSAVQSATSSRAGTP